MKSCFKQNFIVACPTHAQRNIGIQEEVHFEVSNSADNLAILALVSNSNGSGYIQIYIISNDIVISPPQDLLTKSGHIRLQI